MKLPGLKNRENSYRSRIVEFKGYNASAVISAGEFSDTQNISTNEYPCIVPRPPRSVYQSDLTNPTAICGKIKMAYVDGTGFYYDNALKGTVISGKKQIVSIGDRFIIFPDKKYYDISDNVFGSLEETYTSGAGQFTFTTDSITTTGSDFNFHAGDAIKIEGCTVNIGNNTTAVIIAVTSKNLSFAANTFKAGNETSTISLKREIPDMDYICEFNNRLWGCKGSDIYASKLGDPFNFNYFAGLSTDSYAVPVGSDGDFTGCIGFSTHIVFFKENYLHKIFGSKPSNYQMSTNKCYGLQAGCEKSLVTVNDALYFKSRVGVVMYYGSEPELISEKFGNISYSDAVAGSDGNKYYISLKSGTTWSLFSYDVRKGLWIKEDNTQVNDFTNLDGNLYFLNAADKKIYNAIDRNGTEVIAWKAEFGELNEQTDGKKAYTKFIVHMELFEGSSIIVSINCDRKGFQQIYSGSTGARKTITIPIIPTRCDFFNLKIEGSGKCRIYSLTKNVQVGSEV